MAKSPAVNSAFFRPRGIALLGVSGDRSSRAGRSLCIPQEIGYSGKLYPVNPKYKELGGLTCYPSVLDIPGEVDLSLITVPAPVVPQVLRECGQKKIPFNIVLSAGYAEAGRAERQEELGRIAHQYGIRLIGPNCVGMINLLDRVTATWSAIFDEDHNDWSAGNIGLVSQSGSLGTTLVNQCALLGTPVGTFVSTGNEVDLGALDFIRAMLEDRRIKVIGGFLESLKNGSDLKEIGIRATELNKPLVFLKATGSPSGQATALTHTGKVASSVGITRAVFKQTGCIFTDEPEQFLDFIHLFSIAPVFPRNGVAVIATSGGQAVLTANHCHHAGLQLSPLEDKTHEKLAHLMKNFGSHANPVHTVDRGRFGEIIRIVLEDDTVHSVLLIATGRSFDGTIAGIEELPDMAKWAEAHNKIMIGASTSIIGRNHRDPVMDRRLREAGIAVYENPVRAVRALGALVAHGDRVRTFTARPPSGARRAIAASAAAKVQTTSEVVTLLSRYGVPLVPSQRVMGEEAAERAAAQLGYPVVLKVVSPNIPHKTEVGGVEVNLSNNVALREAFRRVVLSVKKNAPEASIECFEVQKMIPHGIEVNVSGLWDPEFGPIVVVGSGGTLVELSREPTYRLAPVDRELAKEMISESGVGRLLKGYRGRDPGDENALADCIVSVSEAIVSANWLQELEINPVIVGRPGEGVWAVDILAKQSLQGAF